MSVAVALLLGMSPASAYETDQLTHRHEPLADSTGPANRQMDRLLMHAVAETNGQLGCEASLERTRWVLSTAIWWQTSASQPVPERGFIRGQGFDRFGAFLETSDEVDRRDFLERTDIFSEVGWWQSVVLRFAGTASTTRIADTYIGTDKTDHFLSEGLKYARRSRFGRKPDRALRFGTTTERTIYGMLTSNAFSYADLRANFDGERFYNGLLQEGSVLQLDRDGCVVQVRGWDWREWISWEYDELLNPSVFTPEVVRAIGVRLAADTDHYCAAWASLTAEERQQQDRAVGATTLPYVRGRHPTRIDPFQLDALCTDASVETP